jgi:hypothetical protein
MSEPLNEARVRALSKHLFKVVADHYKSQPIPKRSQVLEVLNALAITTATVLAAGDESAQMFFDLALENQITMLRAQPPGSFDHG